MTIEISHNEGTCPCSLLRHGRRRRYGGVRGTEPGCADAGAHPEFGTSEFDAPIDKTFSSCVNALKTEGYEVAVAQEEKGLIITKPKIVYQGAAGGQGYATLITMEKRYTFRLEAVGPNRTRVVASPEAIENGRDVTGEQVWTMHFQQADWAKLFRRVQSLL